MIIKCTQCGTELEFEDDIEYDETTKFWCDDCIESFEGTMEDRVYDEMVGK